MFGILAVVTAGTIGGFLLTKQYRQSNAATSKQYVGKKVVIVGASSGIGRCITLEYAKLGSCLLLIARREELLKDLVNECHSLNNQCRAQYVVADICVPNDRERLRDACQAWTHDDTQDNGGIDILVLNAGIMSSLPFSDIPQTSIRAVTEQIFNTNAIGPILLTHMLLPFLKRNRRQTNSQTNKDRCTSSIAVISSVASKIPAPTRSLYCATKSSLHIFFESIRIELERDGVNVTLVCPGSVETELRGKSIDLSTNDGNSTATTTTSTEKAAPKVLKPEQVAKSTIEAVHTQQRIVYLPKMYWFVECLRLLVPGFVDQLAKAKYGFDS